MLLGAYAATRVSAWIADKRAQAYYDSLPDMFEVQEVPTERIDQPGLDESPEGNGAALLPEQTDPTGENTIVRTPETIAFTKDFDALRAACPGVVGWIRIEGTSINYPLMQSDDNDYFLTHLPSGQQNKAGSIFLDYRVSADFTSPVTPIFGHNLLNGKMFSALEGYKQQSFYHKHPSAQVFIPDEEFIVQFFAAFVLDSYEETLPLRFSGEQSFNRFIEGALERSLISSSVTAAFGDRLVYLITCDYTLRQRDQGRTVVVGKIS